MIREGLLFVESRPDDLLGTGAVRYRLVCGHGQSTGAFIPAARRLSGAVVLDLLVWRHRASHRCRCEGEMPGRMAAANGGPAAH